jgi:CDP-diacylglycerol pyrophosphatase
MLNSRLSPSLGKGQAGCILIQRQAVLRVSILLRNLTNFAAAICLIAAVFAGQPAFVSAANRDELWFVVDDLCLPAYRSLGVAFPCLEVNITNGLERGFAVLQVPSSAAHVLVVPTSRISGIESPALQREDTPNYWQAAWDSRRFVEQGCAADCPVIRLEWR